MESKQLDAQFVAGTYSRFDVCFTKGKGELLYDEDGKEYIDFGSGIAVNSLGASDEGWQQAVIAQIQNLSHVSNLYYTTPQAKLAEALCAKTGFKKVFFSNSGAEANECAIKVARKYSFDKYGKGRDVIITLKNSFHGRTITTLAATGQDVFHDVFFPFTEGFVHAEPDNFEEIEALVEKYPVCGIFIELVQGEGGVHALDPTYVKKVAALAAEKDILLMVDEVQTGNGRTGDLYAFMGYGITPDVVSTAKGLAGGLPLGATMLGAKCEHVLTAGSHGSTFGGNPICAAGALYVLSQLDEKLLGAIKEKSAYLVKELSASAGVEEVSGKGLMLGLTVGCEAKEVVKACLAQGLVVLTAKDKVRLLPPLTISKENLVKGTKILKQVIAELTKEKSGCANVCKVKI